ADKPSQHMQRNNLRRVGLALIPASRLSDLSGCWSLLLGSASLHRSIVERVGRECNVAIRDRILEACFVESGHYAACSAFPGQGTPPTRRGARLERMLWSQRRTPAARSFETSALQNLLDSRGLGLIWGQAAAICPACGLIGGAGFPDAVYWHSGWITWCGRPGMRP